MEKQSPVTAVNALSSFGWPRMSEFGLHSAAYFRENFDQAIPRIDHALSADKNYADLSDLLQVSKHNIAPTVGGLQEMDYVKPVIKSGGSSMGEWESLQRKPLPPELIEQFSRVHCNCMMGLFPEIRRAWLTVDSDIYVWNYEDGSDLAYFDGLTETILAVSLVRPKPGVFLPYIRYLLCLATPVDIVLLGVSFDSLSPEASQTMEVSKNVLPVDVLYNEMHLLPEPIFVLPADGVHITAIEASLQGRIFAAGKDGCLYEITYQATDGWFSRKCRKINHSKSLLSYVMPTFLSSLSSDDPLIQLSIDDTRNILYTLSEKNVLQLFDLGDNGQSFSRVEILPYRNVQQHAANVTGNNDCDRFGQIIHISAIPRNESTNIHLVAVTSTGVRFFFVTSPFGSGYCRPNMLRLVHVRMPPGFTTSGSGHRPTKVHKAVCSKGTVVLCSTLTDDSDMLWTMSNDSFPFVQHLKETFETVVSDGQTWALAAIPSLFPVPSVPSIQLKADPPVIVSQTTQHPRQFVLLSSKGSYMMTKMGPADQLRRLLSSGEVESPDVRSFFTQHKEQACAMCLVLICAKDSLSKQVKSLAATAFMKYGGFTLGGLEMQSSYSMPYATPGPANVNRHLQFESPALSYSMNRPLGSELGFSSRHDGLYLFVARVLRLTWEEKLVKDLDVPTATGWTQYLVSALQSDLVMETENRLSALLEFLNSLPQFVSPFAVEGLPVSRPFSRGDDDDDSRRKQLSDTLAREAESVRQLTALVTVTLECLALWRILCEHQFHIVVHPLSTDMKTQLKSMTLKGLVTAGKELTGSLINNLIKMYIDDSAATDAISSRLRELCPSLYSPEDALLSKASESMQQSKLTQNNLTRTKHLEDALKLYKQVCLYVDLALICSEFASVQFYRGIVDLALTTASKRDPQNYAHHYYRHHEHPDDRQGHAAYAARRDCYRCILDCLDYLLNCGQFHPQAPSIPTSPGPPKIGEQQLQLSATEADKYVSEVYSLIVESDDELMHVALYEWLIVKGLSEKLLEIKSPYLEQYLLRNASLKPDDKITLDFMWKFYEKSGNFLAAAKILSKLSEKYSTEIKLRQRVEYLSRAIVCAKTATSRVGSSGEFLFELEEKMEVAKMQLLVYDALLQVNTDASTAAASSLDTQLVDITTLYGDYAAPNGLAECKLAIVHCAGHYDVTLVETFWQEIIDNDLKSTNGLDTATRSQHLSAKMVKLGLKYSSSDRYFPFPYLIKALEKVNCELNFEAINKGYVINIMQQIGISLYRLFTVYDRLHKTKEIVWRSLRQPYHLLHIVTILFEMYVASPTLVSLNERKLLTSTALDAVARYRVELQSDGNVSGDGGKLLARLNDLRIRLERLL